MTPRRWLCTLWICAPLAACGGDPTPEEAPPPPLVVEPELTSAPVDAVHVVRDGETFGEICGDQGIPHAEMQAMLDTTMPLHDLTKIKPGRAIQLVFDSETDAILALAYPFASGNEWVVVERPNTGAPFEANLHEIPYDIVPSVATATITEKRNSFWSICTQIGMNEADILALAEIFRYDLDFNSQVKAGDQLAVWIEEQYLDGSVAKDQYGHALAARYVNEGKVHEVIRFSPTGGKPEYFTRDGMSTRKQFLRSPLKVMRVGSGFSRNRFHPILHKNRPHYGTDFSGPSGTPVHAIGDGRVTFAGWKGGYGNLVIIQHDKRYSTRYAHLSAFGKGIKAGSNVDQGQIIGKVGATGLATGPHLHFEFRVNGNAVDFMKQEFEHTEPISDADRPAFEAVRDRYLLELDAVLPPAATSDTTDAADAADAAEAADAATAE